MRNMTGDRVDVSNNAHRSHSLLFTFKTGTNALTPLASNSAAYAESAFIWRQHLIISRATCVAMLMLGLDQTASLEFTTIGIEV